MYQFTKYWFNQSELRQKIHKYLNSNDRYKILEIGCYEGQSTVFFSDHYLNHENSSMICVDPFLNITNNDHENLLNDVEMRFDHNLSQTKNKDKISVHKIISDSFFESYNEDKFDFIYIDGCHEPDIIQNDINNSLKLINKNGIIWMDDYLGGQGYKIKNQIDYVLNEAKNKYEFEIIHRNYQIAIRIY
jgi:predicted O-methyltransferase YrrM